MKKSDKNSGRQSKDLLASYGALSAVRKELKANITDLRLEMRGEFKKFDAKFNQVDARFNQVDAQLKTMNSNIEKMNAANARMLAIYEEQNSRNKASFEGAEFVREKQAVMDQRLEALEEFQKDFQSRLKKN